MSYSKMKFEEENPELVAALRCTVCNVEATDGDHGRRIGDDEWVCSKHKAQLEPSYTEMAVIQ
jgi:hypothetical protein